VKGLKSSRASFWEGRTGGLELGADDADGAAGVVDALAERFWRKRLLALQRVREGLEGRLLAPRQDATATAVSKRASTASWSMPLFVAHDTSGAWRSMSFFNRLLRLMTRR